MTQRRAIFFIDGFNLYHAIDNLKRPYLKWVNYRRLALLLMPPKTHQLVGVFYFSAYAPHFSESLKRHKQYVKALNECDVKHIMGRFRTQDKKCLQCGCQWLKHEEKETDVNIALTMLDLAHKGEYDHAFLISNDSDLAPAIRLIRRNFPNKSITTVVPPNSRHSNELIQVSSEKAKITVSHLERCLLPCTIYDKQRKIVTTRPKEYEPPTSGKVITGISPYHPTVNNTGKTTV